METLPSQLQGALFGISEPEKKTHITTSCLADSTHKAKAQISVSLCMRVC